MLGLRDERGPLLTTSASTFESSLMKYLSTTSLSLKFRMTLNEVFIPVDCSVLVYF